jgi:excisionase family DNA binding protein
MNSDLIIGAEGAAQYTGISRSTVYRLVEKGHIPAVRKGRRLYFRASELDRTFSTQNADQ